MNNTESYLRSVRRVAAFKSAAQIGAISAAAIIAAGCWSFYAAAPFANETISQPQTQVFIHSEIASTPNGWAVEDVSSALIAIAETDLSRLDPDERVLTLKQMAQRALNQMPRLDPYDSIEKQAIRQAGGKGGLGAAFDVIDAIYAAQIASAKLTCGVGPKCAEAEDEIAWTRDDSKEHMRAVILEDVLRNLSDDHQESTIRAAAAAAMSAAGFHAPQIGSKHIDPVEACSSLAQFKREKLDRIARTSAHPGKDMQSALLSIRTDAIAGWLGGRPAEQVAITAIVEDALKSDPSEEVERLTGVLKNIDTLDAALKSLQTGPHDPQEALKRATRMTEIANAVIAEHSPTMMVASFRP